ncbi:NPCBM/NEW2 domain-containing protein [Luteolibacter sp. Populi]|uniref:NPCBM/NEW2 domain-containing protein n=1 Tax=Luteolibacter sp. Populi TaxID=3230487 RepID=UPI003465BE4F
MKRIFLFLLLLSGAAISALAQDSLPVVQKAAEAKFEAIGDGYRADLAKLKDQLLIALGKARDTAKKEGDLDGVNALGAEIERWKSEEDIPLVESGNAEISKLNEVYKNAAAARLVKKQRAVVAWFRSYDGRLAELEKKLVSGGKIKDAEEVRSERDARRQSSILQGAQEAVKVADAAVKEDKPAAAAPAKSWFNLKAVKWKKTEGSEHFFRNLEKPDGAVAVNDQRLNARDYIFAHASGRIEYEFDKPVTEFRASACLADLVVKGNSNQSGVYFSIETAEGQVFRSKLISGSNPMEKVEISFNPSKKLVLIVDDNRDDRGDWSLWVNPQYR